jgi:23S rRNA (uracil1939-C5)-methyltransferase
LVLGYWSFSGAWSFFAVPTVELTIHDVAYGGKGVARDTGKAVFIPFTIGGERVAAKIVREKKQFAEAELIEVLEPSPERVAAPCPYFGRCGGCSYQHMSYPHQLELKARQVEQAMRRIARLVDPPMRPIVPSPLPYGYRNRITVHAQDDAVGFYRRDVHELMDIAQCPISMPEVNRALAELRATRPRDGHYSLRAHSGPRVFAQTNDAIADAIAEFIATILTGKEGLLIDAFCGAGFFTKRLAPKFERVIGIDWDRFAIGAARKNARPNETYIAGDVAIELAKASRSASRSGDFPVADPKKPRSSDRDFPDSWALIVDPPATGLSAEMRRTILDSAPRTLIYVSCNPPTLARDLGELQSRFAVVSITPFDMFPQTAEIEAVVHLRAADALSVPQPPT